MLKNRYAIMLKSLLLCYFSTESYSTWLLDVEGFSK